LRDRALRAIGDLPVRAEHVGSTAVPGCASKPVIDLDVVVTSSDDVRHVIERLEAVGYVHEGELGVRGRAAFLWPSGEKRHHLYVVVEGTDALDDHVAFRDRLRSDPSVVESYSRLKRELADRYGSDRDAYTEGKSDFITRVLADAHG
jgi:GrpB-like predicted nucleotidyltransferase (UPF0157 family)